MVVKVALNLQLWQNTSSQRVACNSSVTVAKLFSQKTYLATFLAFLYDKPCNQETQSRCARSKKQHTSPEMLIYMLPEKRILI